MHYKCYVLLPVSDAQTSLEARQCVLKELDNDTSFVGEGGRFASPICDWFVVGGRWSGCLYPEKISSEFWTHVKHLQQPNDDYGITQSFIREHHEHLNNIWTKMGGKYACPLTRNQYGNLGEEDDACVLEAWLASELDFYLRFSGNHYVDDVSIINENWGTPRVITLNSDLFYNLKDFNQVIGKYWVIVIDYHR